MVSAVKRLGKKIDIDGAIAYTILSRMLQAGSGVVAVFLIARFLSSNEQGYYYTFGSILAIQIFFELGLSGIITQYTAHEFAYLRWENAELLGEEYYKSRLSSLLRFFVRWFFIISIILFAVLVVAGFYFFSNYNTNLNIDWEKPWIILCLTTSLNLFIDPLLAFFDGLGEVKDMAKLRLIQKGTNIIFLFIFFALGFKLYSSPLASLLAIIINYIQILFTKRITLLKVIWYSQHKWVINYMNEVFPFQWRIAISWISGYFIFQLFNPILFVTEGPRVAGQMGMTLAALNGMIAISISWLITKVPAFSNFIATKNYSGLDVLFNKTLKGLTLVSIFLLMIFNTLVWYLNSHHLIFSNRFLPILPCLLLSLTFFVNQFVTAWATYLRCHKKEPFLIQSIVISVLCALSILVFGKKFGLIGMVASYCVVMSVISFTWAYLLFITKKRQWHVQ